MDKRIRSPNITPPKGTELPLDYLKMVKELLENHFAEQLKTLSEKTATTQFHSFGSIHTDEILLGVSLLQEKQITSTSFYASCDFDPTASSPKAEDLLACCLDALGSLLAEIFDFEKYPNRIEHLTSHSLSSMENVPFEWTPMTVNKRKVFLRVDRSNPLLENLTDVWLKKNDPEFQSEEELVSEEDEDFLKTRLALSQGKKETKH